MEPSDEQVVKLIIRGWSLLCASLRFTQNHSVNEVISSAQSIEKFLEGALDEGL